MTEEKEVKSSGDDTPQSVNNDPLDMRTEMLKKKHTEDMENVEEKVEKVEGDEEEEDEDEDEDEEEEEEGEGAEEGEEVEEEEEEDDDEDEEEDGDGNEDEEDDSDEETEDSEEETEDEHENLLKPRQVDVPIDGGKVMNVEVSLEKNSDRIVDSPIHGVENSQTAHADNVMPSVDDGGIPVTEASVKDNAGTDKKSAISNQKELSQPDNEEDMDVKSNDYGSLKERRSEDESIARDHSSSLKVDCMKEEELKNDAKTKERTIVLNGGNLGKPFMFDTDTSGGGESGTEDEQATFMMELEKFHKERSLEFKPPKFYGEPLNLLKLWRSVMRLGGYDKVTTCKFWRQVGESFKPPKTCTTVSWTFRIFYEKALLDYERYRSSSDGSSISGSLAVHGTENQASGSFRARRDAAARCMQGWHSQRILDNGEVSDPIIKDKNSMSLGKKEKQLKNLGILKRKNPSSTDLAVKPVRTKFPKSQTETTVIDIGSPADWVKINVRETKDCYEVYALVPGLLREEVRVQSDPAGRLVISGEPENPDNPWSVTPFKKVVSLPSRIDPHQTSAVVTLHGQLFVRVPFEQFD